MEAKVLETDHCLEISIPKDLVKELNIHPGDTVEMDVKNKCIVITPIGK